MDCEALRKYSITYSHTWSSLPAETESSGRLGIGIICCANWGLVRRRSTRTIVLEHWKCTSHGLKSGVFQTFPVEYSNWAWLWTKGPSQHWRVIIFKFVCTDGVSTLKSLERVAWARTLHDSIFKWSDGRNQEHDIFHTNVRVWQNHETYIPLKRRRLQSGRNRRKWPLYKSGVTQRRGYSIAHLEWEPMSEPTSLFTVLDELPWHSTHATFGITLEKHESRARKCSSSPNFVTVLHSYLYKYFSPSWLHLQYLFYRRIM